MIAMEKNTQGLVNIAKLVFQFAKVDRVTLHDDGVTLESDTDHTVMLSICACSIAQKIYPDLDIGKVAQFSVIHDLVEAYAGDTDTFNLNLKGKEDKIKREEEAFLRIKKEFGAVYPWIANTIEEYESLESKEAKFVKLVDKVMTKLTHMANGGAHLKKHNKTKEETDFHYGKQADELEQKYGQLFPEVIVILRKLTDDIRREVYAK